MLRALKAFKGGIHPRGHKYTEADETIVMPVPSRIVIPMQQHIGKICKAIVKKGDTVYRGQVIGIPEDGISTPIHASCSGVVKSVGPSLYAGGRQIVSVEITPDKEQVTDPSIAAIKTREPKEMIEAIRNSGIVGLGGAGFPTWFKLTPPKGDTFDTLLINGAECEPYITSDYREMLENPEGIIKGIEEVLHMTGINKAIIGIEDNKIKAIHTLVEMLDKNPRIQVMKLRTRYPQGGEKQLIYACTGRVVATGKLPSSVGVLVLSVSTVSAIHQYLSTGMPLIERRITVTGDAVTKPQNVRVPIGSRIEDVISFCGGFKADPARIVMGGPMMGIGQFSVEPSILKQSNAILALVEDEIDTREETACIRCGRCVDACPMHLMPFELNHKILNGLVDEADKTFHLQDCMVCGSCSYVCPAARNLVQSFRLGKAEIKAKALRQARVDQQKVEV